MVADSLDILPKEIETLVKTVKNIDAVLATFGLEDRKQGTESLAVVAERRPEFDVSRAAALELHRCLGVQNYS
jgi:UPF0288 family protein (methanogenesis marker protein 3)